MKTAAAQCSRTVPGAVPAWNGVATSSSPFPSRSHGDEDIVAPKPIPMEAASRGVPWRLLAVGTFVCALLPWFVPGIADALVLDRERLMAGEFWRLFTHPWVHFSIPHLIVDLACLLGLGIVAARKGLHLDWRWALRFLAVIGLTGVTCLLLDPRLDRLGGLSGVNVVFAVWLGRALWNRGDRWVALGLLGGLGLKLVAEWAGWATFVRFDEPGVEACVLSHWAAAAWGGVVYGLSSAGAPHLVPGRFRPGGPKDSSPRREPWVDVDCGSPAPAGRQTHSHETGHWRLGIGSPIPSLVTSATSPSIGVRPV